MQWRSLGGVLVALALGAAACANGAGNVPSDDPGTEEDSSRAMPEGTGFDTPASSGSSSGGKSSTSSGGGSTSSGASGGSTSTSSSGGSSTSSGGGSTTSSSGASGSTTSSSGAAGGACGVCDRNWTCNNITDYWATDGARCINQRTTTALRCDFKFDQGTSYSVGTWSGGPSKITLVYPMLGGGTKSYDCFP